MAKERVIDWSLILQQPDRLHFMDSMEGAEGDREVDDCAEWKSERECPSTKSLPAISAQSRSCDSSVRRVRQYWTLGKLGPDLSNPRRIEQVIYFRTDRCPQRCLLSKEHA